MIYMFLQFFSSTWLQQWPAAAAAICVWLCILFISCKWDVKWFVSIFIFRVRSTTSRLYFVLSASLDWLQTVKYSNRRMHVIIEGSQCLMWMRDRLRWPLFSTPDEAISIPTNFGARIVIQTKQAFSSWATPPPPTPIFPCTSGSRRSIVATTGNWATFGTKSKEEKQNDFRLFCHLNARQRFPFIIFIFRCAGTAMTDLLTLEWQQTANSIAIRIELFISWHCSVEDRKCSECRAWMDALSTRKLNGNSLVFFDWPISQRNKLRSNVDPSI